MSSLYSGVKLYRNACNEISQLLTNSLTINITSKSGTNLFLQTKGRKGNFAPGSVLKPGDLSSPPDVECNIAPIESKSQGFIVIDGSIPIPSIGILKEPISIEVTNGICKVIDGDKEIVKKLNQSLTSKKSRRIIGEFGIGLNPFSKIAGRMLEDEGAFNTCHFGIGSNTTLGGSNNSDGHIDLVMKEPLLKIDDVKTDIYSLFNSLIKNNDNRKYV